MRSDEHVKRIQVDNNEKYTIMPISDLPEYNINDYDLMDDKDINRYYSDIEKIIRQSFEYKEMIKFLRENMNMNKCSFFENVNNIDTFKIKIHIHHHPFTLYDIAVIVCNKRMEYGENLDPEMVAKEVMFLHYGLYVGLIPLSETVHELVHNSYLFIPMDKVMGKFNQFKNMYEQFMTAEQLDVWDRNCNFSDTFRNECNNNIIISKKYIYLDVTGNYDLPSFESVIESMNKKIKDLDNKSCDIETKPRIKIFEYVEH